MTFLGKVPSQKLTTNSEHTTQNTDRASKDDNTFFIFVFFVDPALVRRQPRLPRAAVSNLARVVPRVRPTLRLQVQLPSNFVYNSTKPGQPTFVFQMNRPGYFSMSVKTELLEGRKRADPLVPTAPSTNETGAPRMPPQQPQQMPAHPRLQARARQPHPRQPQGWQQPMRQEVRQPPLNAPRQLCLRDAHQRAAPASRGSH